MRKVTLRVVFADDNYLVRAGVSALLSEDDEIELVTAVADADALIRAVAEHRPDAVLTDIRMPPTHTIEGIEAAKRIRTEYPEIGVVVLSQFADDDYAFELLENGVGGLGYLLKERIADRDELIGQVITNLNVVLGSLGDQTTQLDKAVTSLSELVQGLADRKTDISNAVASASPSPRETPVTMAASISSCLAHCK